MSRIDRPKAWFPMNLGAANYCSFRGMLMKSYIYFQGQGPGFNFPRLGEGEAGPWRSPAPPDLLKTLQNRRQKPIFTAFIPLVHGVLDDYFESWFLVDKSPHRAPRPKAWRASIRWVQGKSWLPAAGRAGSGGARVIAAPGQPAHRAALFLRLGHLGGDGALGRPAAGRARVSCSAFVTEPGRAVEVGALWSNSNGDSTFFAIIGMFMLLFGMLLPATRCSRRGIRAWWLLWCALQKLGASAAVGIGVGRRHLQHLGATHRRLRLRLLD